MKEKYQNNNICKTIKNKIVIIIMGILVHDTLYSPNPITNVYVNIDSIIMIKKNGNVYDVTTHYCCYKNKDDDLPFHKVEITVNSVIDLNNMYEKLYELTKKDFIKTSNVLDV